MFLYLFSIIISNKYKILMETKFIKKIKNRK